MKYLISGIGPGESGVGRLMRVLKPKFELMNYEVVVKRDSKSIGKFLNEKSYAAILNEIISRMVDEIKFNLKINKIKNSEVIAIHPQTLGYSNLFKLIKFNKVSLYVMDNSFFCIRSYNTHPEKNIECLKCLGSIDPDGACQPFPVKINKSKNIKYLLKLIRISKDINFLTQNNFQSLLVKKHFGNCSSVAVVGMDAEINNYKAKQNLPIQPFSISYDIVFHGASLVAKGLLYFVQLAKELPNYTFFIPDHKCDVVKVLNMELPENITCQKMNWESGLEALVISAKIVINPSIWSAPIEGALIKSASRNNNVATVVTKYGFENEVDSIVNHLRLNPDPVLGASQLGDFLASTDN